MKKVLILTAVFLFAFLASKAQTEKGTQTLGLNLGFSFNNSNDFTISPSNNSTTTLNTKNTQYHVGPTYSYFIADKLEVGGALSYSDSKLTYVAESYATTNDNYPTKEITNNFSGELFIRKYFMYKNTIGFRTQGYLGYSSGNETNTYTPTYAAYNYNSKTTYYSGGANLDLVYYPSKKIGVAATIANLEYYHYNANNTTQGHDNGDNVTFSFINNALSFSVFYVFGSK
jgi:hypothetical protein